MLIKQVEIIPIKPSNGLIGFASVITQEGLYLSSIGIHKRLDGTGYRITYPTKKLGSHNLTIFHPVHKELSHAIEQAIILKAEEIFG